MQRKIKKDGFAISLYITERGVMDYSILYRDKNGLARAKKFVRILAPHIEAFEDDIRGIAEEDWVRLSAPAEIMP